VGKCLETGWATACSWHASLAEQTPDPDPPVEWRNRGGHGVGGAVVRARGEWQLLGLGQIIRHSGVILEMLTSDNQD